MPDPSLDPAIEAKRGRLGRLRTGALVYFLGGLALWIVAAVAVLGEPVPDRVLVRIFFAWALGALLVSIFLGRSPCPRCGRRFFLGPRGGAPFAGECQHCGLPLRGREPGR